jgi:hypothetical protein
MTQEENLCLQSDPLTLTHLMVKEPPLRSELLKEEKPYIKIFYTKRIPNVPEVHYPAILKTET